VSRDSSIFQPEITVNFVDSPEEVSTLANQMIGQKLITKQSGLDGKICNSVMVAERKFPRREFYFAIALEREFNGPVLIASRHGGVNIEDIAADSPDSIVYEPIDVRCGLTEALAELVVKRVGLCDHSGVTVKMLIDLYNLFVDKDALLVEINPYIEDVCLNYFALDAKLSFDESAQFRQPEIFARRDLTQEDPKEVAARCLGMSYIALDGSIGCMVNGAGLAMATLDILKLHGGSPANFLDVGGMGTPDSVKEAVRVILMEPKVRTIFVNIYGGIMRCDIIVQGLLKAIKEFDIKIPIVVRLQGNMHKLGQGMVRQANTSVITRDEFDESAAMAVRCAKIMRLADEGGLDVTVKMRMICDCEPNDGGAGGKGFNVVLSTKGKSSSAGVLGRQSGLEVIDKASATDSSFKVLKRQANPSPLSPALNKVDKAKRQVEEAEKFQLSSQKPALSVPAKHDSKPKSKSSTHQSSSHHESSPKPAPPQAATKPTDQKPPTTGGIVHIGRKSK
jgi:succinyl-CoA synthetase beta subunit